MNKILAAMVTGLALASACHAAGARMAAADVQSMARYGCTYVQTWTPGDLSGTTTNATLTFTNTFAGPVSVKCAGYLLSAPFESAYTNGLSLKVSVGTTGNPTNWIAAAETARSATPTVYSALDAGDAVTADGVSVVTTFVLTGPVHTMDALKRGGVQTFWKVLGKNYH